MQVNNNVHVRQPNFGMALKIEKNNEAIKKLPKNVLEKIQEAEKELKDTQYFDVKVCNNLDAFIESNKSYNFIDEIFGEDLYSDSQDLFRVHSWLDKPGSPYPKFQIYDPFQMIAIVRSIAGDMPRYTAHYTRGQKFRGVEDIDFISRIAKILDNVAKYQVDKRKISEDAANVQKEEKDKQKEDVRKLLERYESNRNGSNRYFK